MKIFILFIALMLFGKHAYPKIDRFLRFRGIRWHKKIFDNFLGKILIAFFLISLLSTLISSSSNLMTSISPNSIKTAGSVIHMQIEGNGRSEHEKAIVEFYAENGERYITTTTGHYAVGEILNVVYPKGNPDLAVVKTYQSTANRLLTAIPTFLILAAALLIFLRPKIDDFKRKRRLKSRGFK